MTRNATAKRQPDFPGSERRLVGLMWHHKLPRCPGDWVYIVTNRPNGTLYFGVTSRLAQRA